MVAFVFLLSGVARAEPVAIAVSVTNEAFVERGNRRLKLVPRGQIENGDVVRTGAQSQVEVLFLDRTRVAVGPNARFEISNVELDENRRARRFSLGFLSGAFRFLSGRSDKRIYEISTPTATMGVRGTTFDFTIDNRRQTRVALFDGAVEFCTRRTRCAILQQGCAMVQSVGFGRFEPPETRAVRDTWITTWFPFVVSQRGLDGGFRARTESCGEIEGVTFNIPAIAPRLVPAPLTAPAPVTPTVPSAIQPGGTTAPGVGRTNPNSGGVNNNASGGSTGGSNSGGTGTGGSGGSTGSGGGSTGGSSTGGGTTGGGTTGGDTTGGGTTGGGTSSGGTKDSVPN